MFSVKLTSKDLFCYAHKRHDLQISIKAAQNHNTVNMGNAKLLWTASCRMRGSDSNLNHRVIKIQRDNWKSLVKHLIKAEITSKLDEAAQVNHPLSNDGEFTWVPVSVLN